MKTVALLSLLVLSFGCSAQAVELDAVAEEGRKPVLVELFTSEGCASCPPAEALLAKLGKEQPIENAELITLAFHVDYWDELGWKDRFASPLFTQRQNVYNQKFRSGGNYTPQMVVDGEFEFIGSREKAAERAFQKAVKSKKGSVDVGFEENGVRIAVHGLVDNEQATVYVAIAEDGLGSAIRSGENAGKNLTHLSVVRKLFGIAMIPAGKTSHSSLFTPQIDPGWDKSDLKLVVFVQENKSREVLAATQIRFGDRGDDKI